MLLISWRAAILAEPRQARPRRSARATSGRHAVEPRQDLHRAEKQNFAHQVAALLSEASHGDEFDALVLVAPAHVLSELRSALDEPTRRKITAHLQKDLTKIPNADLANHLGDLSGD